MAPHSSTLAWRIPWALEPGGLRSMGSLGVGHDWATSLSLFTFMHWRRKWQPTPVFLSGESQGRGSLVGCRLWGRTVRHDWSDLAAAARQYICAHTMLVKTPFPSELWSPCLSFFLSLSISVFLADFLEHEAGCITQEILASLLLPLSHRWLWATRFQSIKGPQQVFSILVFKCVFF